MATIRAGIATVWLLSPPVLAVIALRLWKHLKRPDGLKAGLPVAIGVAVLANWLLFIAFAVAGQIGGFGSHYRTTRVADVFLLASFLVLVASIFAYVGRWQLSLASFLMLALWAGSEMVA